MKIQLTNDEFYEIKIPDEMSASEFGEFFDRLKKLTNLISITSSANLSQNFKPKKYNKNPNLKFMDTKEKCMDIMQYFYFGTRQDKQRIVELIGDTSVINLYKLFKLFEKWKIKFNIQPREIGFIRYGDGHNKFGEKIPNWVIRSHTGIFDENGNATTDNTD